MPSSKEGTPFIEFQQTRLEASGHGHRPRRLLEGLGLIRLLPGELRFGSAEVAAAGGFLVDRTTQVEVLDDA